MVDYLDKHGTWDWGQAGLIGKVLSSHNSLMQRFRGRLLKIQELLAESGAELSRAADYYDEADRRSAQALDDFNPHVEVPVGDRWSPDMWGSRWSPPDPLQFLVDPREPDDSISNGFANPLDMFNYLSPSAWINEAIEALTGTDVLGWLTGVITGDWASLYAFGDVVLNIGAYLAQLGSNIRQGILFLSPWWNGNAADAAAVYFCSLGDCIAAVQSAMAVIGDCYHKAAVGAWILSSELGNIVQALADEAILAGACAVAGDVLAETGVGLIGGYAAATLIVGRMLQQINRASRIVNNFGGTLEALVGLAMDAGYQDADPLTATPVPSAPYSHPQV